MKYFIVTDVHGSAYWAQETVRKFRRSRANVLVLLGDIYNHGPRNPIPTAYAPHKVAEIFNGIADKIICIQGNCDSEVDAMISQFHFLRDNVVYLNGRKVFFTHGHVYNKDNLPCLHHGDLLVYGHFHVSSITQTDGVICVNVGSCTLPKDGMPPYCILDDKGVYLYDFNDVPIASRLFSSKK